MLLEICSGSLFSAVAAQEGGAHRVELCDNLMEGGTTPSPGTIRQAVKLLKIPVFVLIRPRPGDFLYSDYEFEAMKEDIRFCKEQKVDGIVTGILKPDGAVDKKRTAELVRLAYPMQTTFHRAFDMTRDPMAAMEDIIELGMNRILTSGQAANALEGAGLISELIKKAGNRITIMPGGGINEVNFLDLQRKTNAEEFHASLRSPVKSLMKFRNDIAFMGTGSKNEYTRMETDVNKVAEVVKLIS